VAAKALLKLRSLCLHSDTNEVLNGHETQQRNFSSVGVGFSNIEVAQSIVDGSSKMRELLRILLDEAKTEAMVTIYNANGHLTLRRSTFHRVASVSDTAAVVYCNGSSKCGEGSQKKSQKNNRFAGIPASGNKRKKVLILASLPEALLLVHIFLNSCGIAHDFLTTFTSNVLHGSIEKNEMMQLSNFSQISAWVEAQRVLARFDRTSFEDCNNSPRCDVLLANPAIVGAAHLGLSPGAADMIVSVDEDWTNQGKMMIESIIKYCQSRHSDRIGRSFQLIKLICADTCEESFLVSGVSNSNKIVSSFSENLEDVDSANGTIDAAIEKKTENENIDFASSIIRLRNQELSLVLKSPISLDFSSGFPPIFLPRHNVSDESLQEQHEEDLAFANELVLAETSMQTIPRNSYMSHSNSPHSSVGDISCDKAICPPGLVGRRDLNSLSLRLHCFRQGRSLRSFERDVQIETLSRSLASDIRYEKELAEAWQRAGFGCSPGDQTETLLFYAMTELQKFPSAAESVPLSHLPKSEQTVLNPDLIPSSVYALSYSSNRTKFHDGHSSREPLIYSPPLIPWWEVIRTIDDKRHFHPVDVSVSSGDNKIHTLPMDAAVESTLLNDVMELEMDIDLIPDIDSSTFSGEIVTPFSIGVEDKKYFLDQFEGMTGEKSGSTAVGKSHADYPLMTLPSTCDEVQRDSDTGVSTFRHSVDGKILNMSNSISIASATPIETGKYRYWRDSLETDFDASTLEPEDFWVSRSCFLESMLLYVNRPLQTTGQAKASLSKKNKRKLTSMNSNEPGQSNPIPCAPFGIPNLHTDASLLPVVQTHNKGREGLMLFLIQEKLDDLVQQKFRESSSNNVNFKSVSRDSFGLGPFGLGDIGGCSCTRDFFSPSVKAGVVLPLERKHTHIEDNITEYPWSEEEDATLVSVALRYSLNWDIVASFVQKLNCTTLRAWWRSPRQCRDRWKYLTTMRPSVSTEARKIENDTRKMSLLPADEVSRAINLAHSRKIVSAREQFMGRTTQISSDRPTILFCCCGGQNFDTTLRDSATLQEKSNQGRDTGQLKERKSILSLMAASGKKKKFPSLTTPSFAGSDLRSGLVTTHPSHSQAVQETVPNFGGQVGAAPVDMWPLQLLDFVERKKSTLLPAAQPNASASASVNISAVTSPPSSSVCGQQPSNIEPPLQQLHSYPTQTRAAISSATLTPLQTAPTNQISSRYAPPESSQHVKNTIPVYHHQIPAPITLQKLKQQAFSGPKEAVKPPNLNRLSVPTPAGGVTTAPRFSSSKQPNLSDKKK